MYIRTASDSIRIAIESCSTLFVYLLNSSHNKYDKLFMFASYSLTYFGLSHYFYKIRFFIIIADHK